ncbi:MAG: glutamate synthase subunit alpha, partial [Bacteroidota bacterium]
TRNYKIRNVNRSVGTKLSGEIAYLYGDRGLPENTIHLRFTGSAGQSFGAFLVHGVRMTLTGEANDYVGKGMSGGEIIVMPSSNRFNSAQEVIVGNTVLYGATGGALFASGRAGERFCVRNSGALAVVEGVGDHGCEYMTHGTVVVLGTAGRNFGAGMTGGVAFVLDLLGDFERRLNSDLVTVRRIDPEEETRFLQAIIHRHLVFTNSTRAQEVLMKWAEYGPMFWKVTPKGGQAPPPATVHQQQIPAAQRMYRY